MNTVTSDRDVPRLRFDAIDNREFNSGAISHDTFPNATRDLFNIKTSPCADFPRHDQKVVLRKTFNARFGLRILVQSFIQNGVGDLVTELVRMTIGDISAVAVMDSAEQLPAFSIGGVLNIFFGNSREGRPLSTAFPQESLTAGNSDDDADSSASWRISNALRGLQIKRVILPGLTKEASFRSNLRRRIKR